MVVDAGSTGTRAVVYRHTNVNPQIVPVVQGADIAGSQHVELPWLFYVGEVEEDKGLYLAPTQ